MLTKQPQLGDKLIYDDGRTRYGLTVMGFLSGFPDVLKFRRDDGTHDLIIWNFTQHLNTNLSEAP